MRTGLAAPPAQSRRDRHSRHEASAPLCDPASAAKNSQRVSLEAGDAVSRARARVRARSGSGAGEDARRRNGRRAGGHLLRSRVAGNIRDTMFSYPRPILKRPSTPNALALVSERHANTDMLKFVRAVATSRYKPRFVYDVAPSAAHVGVASLVDLDSAFRSSSSFPVDFLVVVAGLIPDPVTESSIPSLKTAFDALIRRVEWEIVDAFENPGCAVGVPSNAAHRLHVEIQRVNLLTVRYALLAIREQIEVAAAAQAAGSARDDAHYAEVRRWLRAGRGNAYVDAGLPALGTYIAARVSALKEVDEEDEEV